MENGNEIDPVEAAANELDHKDDLLKEQQESLKVRATEIVNQCEFGYLNVSPEARQACTAIEEIFKEATYALSLVMPGDFRTANCLEALEEASMWAKKSVCVYDKQKRQEAKNAKNTN